MTRLPDVVVLAGPNGAGKSTAAPRLLRGTLAVEEFVNADTLAQGLSAFRPEGVAIEAGRLMWSTCGCQPSSWHRPEWRPASVEAATTCPPQMSDGASNEGGGTS